MTDIFDARLARQIQYDKQRHAGNLIKSEKFYLDRYEDPALVRSRLLESQRLASQVALSKELVKKQKKRKKKVSKKIKLKGETAREKRLMKI